MKLISWNVNGLRACLGKGFQDYFDQHRRGRLSAFRRPRCMQGQAEFAPRGICAVLEQRGQEGVLRHGGVHPDAPL